MFHIIKLVTISASMALAALVVATAPASAEKTAEQIKCEEEGGTWSDKGNGNTFCFKKLPPMHKAGGPSGGGTDGPGKATVNTTRSNIKHAASAACDAACVSEDEDCDGAAERDAKPAKGVIKTSASQNGQTLRQTGAAGPGAACHAINTKGTGASGRLQAAASPPQQCAGSGHRGVVTPVAAGSTNVTATAAPVQASTGVTTGPARGVAAGGPVTVTAARSSAPGGAASTPAEVPDVVQARHECAKNSIGNVR